MMSFMQWSQDGHKMVTGWSQDADGHGMVTRWSQDGVTWMER